MMKKKILLILMSLLLALGLLDACGKSDKTESTGTENIIVETDETSKDSDEPLEAVVDTQNTDAAEEDTAESGDAEDELTETDIDEEYTLQYYLYGEFLETDSLHLTNTEFQVINPADGTIAQSYAYRKLTDNLIALFEEETGTYVICYYNIDGTEYTLNILGATAAAIVGTYRINYLDQGSTATIDFSIDGTAVEDNQVDLYGNDRSAPYEFYYCWYAENDSSMFLLICLDNGYYAYSVEMEEDGNTMNFTEIGGYTYDL